jgi:quercetin dioxygenase-like cupin family protein
MRQKIALILASLVGLGMIFIGARFLLSPEIAEASYGIKFSEGFDYSFHYMKGVRDLFSGLAIGLLISSKQIKALGMILLTGTIIPIADLIIVLGKDYSGAGQFMPHIIAIIACAFSGSVLFRYKAERKLKTAFIRLISPSENEHGSIMQLSVLPSEKTPWHHHTEFAETFEIVEGSLEVGKGKTVLQLTKGEIITIQPHERHYYHNTSDRDCILNVVVSPGSRNFEKSLFILKGLANDGSANAAGIPKRLRDLAVFIYLSNSRMSGVSKIAEPVFRYIAQLNIRNGYMDKLIHKYYSKIVG